MIHRPVQHAKSVLPRIVLLAALMFSLGTEAWGALILWDGGGDGSTWSDATNWNPNTVPIAGDIATIGVTATINLTGAVNIDSLRVSTTAPVTINLAGNTLTAANLLPGTENVAPYGGNIPCNLTVNGTGTLNITASINVMSYGANSTVIMNNNVVLNSSGNAWLDMDPGYVTTFQGDGTSTINFLGAVGGVGGSDVVFDNITVTGGPSFSASRNLDPGLGQTVTVTITAAVGDMPVGYQFYVSAQRVNNSGVTNESYQVAGTAVNTTSNFNLPLVTTAGTYNFNIIYPGAIDGGDGLNLTIFNAFNIPVYQVNFIQAGSTWTGAVGASTDWTNAGNWTNGVPGAGSVVNIGTVLAGNLYPILTASPAAQPGQVTIASGAVLDLNGFNLTATTKVTNNGTLRLRGSETIAGTHVNGSASTVVYYGNLGASSATWGGGYRNITVSGTADTGGAASLSTTGALTIVGTLDINAGGKLSLGTNGISVGGAYENDGTLSLAGSQTLAFTNDTNTGTTEFIAGGTGTGGWSSFFNLLISGGSHNGSATTTVAGTLQIDLGATWNQGAFSLGVSGASTINGTFNGGSLGNTFSSIAGTGTLNASTGTTIISGAMTVSTLVPGVGIIRFTGLGQSYGAYSFYNLEINGSVTSTGSWAIGRNLTINPGGAWTAGAYTHTVAGNWTNTPGLTGFIAGASTIEFTTGAAAQVNGNTTFATFRAVTGPKILTFQTGSTTTVSSFVVTGTAGNLISLTGAGAWTINHLGSPGNALSPNVSFVSVAYSQIDPAGNSLFADDSVDGLNNDLIPPKRWTIRPPGAITSTWNGSQGTNWNDTNNWNLGAPTAIDTALIANVVNQPVLELDSTVDGLTISLGADITIDNYTLTVGGVISNSGTVFRQGTGTISKNDNTSGLVHYRTSNQVIQNYYPAGTADYFNLVLDGAFRFTASSALDITGTLTVNNAGAVLDLDANALALTGIISNLGTVELDGTQTVSLSAGNATGAGTWLYNGVGGTVKDFGPTDYFNLSIDGTPQLAGSTVVAGSLSGTGTLTTNNQNITVTGNVTVENLVASALGLAETITVGGNFTPNTGFTAADSTVVLNTATSVSASGFAYNNLTIAKTAVANVVNLAAGASVGGNLTLSVGTINQGGGLAITGTLSIDATGIYVTGNNDLGAADIIESAPGAVLNASGQTSAGRVVSFGSSMTLVNSGFSRGTSTTVVSTGTGTLTSAANNLGNLGKTGVGTLTLQDALTLTGSVSIAAGVLAANANPITLGGDWTNAASFTSGGGSQTVTFNGAGAQAVISGGSSFNNLTVNKAAGTSPADTLAVGTIAFDVVGTLSVVDGRFEQTGDNGGSVQSSGTLSISPGAFMTWDQGAAGGSLIVTGNVSNSGTLAFNNKNVTIGGTLSGNIELYDLRILSGKNLQPTAGSTLTVRRNMTIDIGGTYTPGTATLVLGGASSVIGGVYTDNNLTKVNLGALQISGAQNKTLASALHANSLLINTSSLLALGYGLTVDTTLSGTGTLTATGSQTIDIGGNVSVSSIDLTGSNVALNIGGSLSTPAANFTAGTSTVTFDGAGAGPYSTTGVSFSTLVMFLGSPASQLQPSAGITVTTGFTQTRGTFVAGAFLHTFSGNWDSYSSGSGANVGFTPGTSTIRLMLLNPSISSDHPFYNLDLDKGATLARNLTVNNDMSAGTAVGTLSLNGRTLTVGRHVTLNANGSLDATTAGSTLVLTGTGNQNITSNNGTWNNLTISTTGTGTVDFIDQLNTTGTIATAGNAYNIELSAGGNSTAAWVFNNSGTVAILNGYTFAGGVTATTPASVSVAGTVETSNDPMNLGSQASNRPVNLVGATSLQTGNGALTLGPVNNAQALDLVLGGGTLNAEGAIGGVSPLASLTLTSAGIATFSRGIRTSGTISLSNSGVLTLSDPDLANDIAGDNISTTAGNFSQTGASTISMAADFNIVGTVDFVSPILLSDDVRITATGLSTFGASATIDNLQTFILAGNGDKDFSAALGGATPLDDITLGGTGTKTFAAPVTLNASNGSLLVNGTTELIHFQGTFGANSVTQNNGANPLRFDGNVTLGAGATTFNENVTLDGLVFSSVGAVAFGSNNADTLTLSGATVTMGGAGVKTFNALVSGIGIALDQSNGSGAMDFNENITFAGGDWQGNVTLGGLTLNASALLTIGTAGGSDTLTLNDGNLIIEGAGIKRFNSSITANASVTTITQLDGSGLLDFNEDLSAVGSLDLLGSVTLGGMTLSSTTGTIQFGSVDTDNDGNNTGADTLILEDGPVLVDTSSGNTAQVYYSTVTGGQTLTVLAGSSSVTFTGVIGGGTAPTGLAVNATNIELGNDTVDATTINGNLAFTAAGGLAAGTITLRGSSVTSTGTQNYTASGLASSKVVADLHANGSWNASSAISVNSPWFFLDSLAGPTVTLSLPDGLNASNDVALYRGSLNIAGQTLDVNGNLAMFGPAYSSDDPDRSGSVIEYLYPDHTPMDAAHSFPAPSGSFGATAVGLNGATLNVAGNFYANGINLNPAGVWYSVIPENYVSTARYANAYYLTVANSQVSTPLGGVNKAVISAAIPAAPYTNNGVTATSALPGSNNMQPDWVSGGTVYCGWDFYDVRIASAGTVYDNLLEVYFTRPIRNSDGEIATAVALAGTFFRATDLDGVPESNPAFSSAYRYTDTTNRDFNGNGQLDLGDLTLITAANTADLLGNWTDINPLVDSDLDGDLTNDHDIDDPLFILAPFTWNTDASGSTAVGAANSGRGALGSTNRAGVGQDISLDLSLMKGALVSAYGKNSIIKYGDQGAAKYMATTDGTSPVLVGAWAGQHNGAVGTTEPYNKHNFLHFRYSEPIDLTGLNGTDASGNAQDGGDASASGSFPIRSRYNDGVIAGATSDRFGLVRGIVPSNEVNFFKPFDDATRVAGSTDITTGVVVDGLGLEYGNGSTVYNFGSRTYDGAAAHVSQADKSNLIYRSGAASAENPSGAHGITIFLAGFSDGNFWPGFLGDPFSATRNTPAASLGIRQLSASLTEAESVNRMSSSKVKDASGNVVEPTSNIYTGKKNGTTGLTIRDSATAAVTLGDVEAGGAGFNAASFRNNWDTAPLAIKPFGPGLEVHTELSGATGKMSNFHVVTMNDVDGDGDEDGGEAALGDGIRDSSWHFPSPKDALALNNPPPRSPPPTSSKDELMAFGFTDKGSAVALDDFKYNLGMATTVTIDTDLNPVTPNVTLNVPNDKYFSIIVDSSLATGNPWGSITTVKVSYNGLGFLTDHAGNVLPLFSEKDSIERTPPNIKVSLAAVGGKRIYVEFDEPVYHWDGSNYSTIQAGDFLYKDVVGPLTIYSFSSVEVLSTVMTDAGLGATSVYLYLTAGATVGPDDAYELRINSSTPTSVTDKGRNPMQMTTDYLFSNIGIGLVNPVYAMDDWINPEFGSSIKALRDFSGKESMSGEGAISIQAKSHDGQKAAYVSAPLALWFDVNVPGAILAGSGKFWSPLGIPGFADSPNGEARLVNETTPPAVGLHDFTLPANDSEFKTDALIQFVMTQNGIALGWTPDPNKPEEVRPWAFKFGAVIDQRSGVSILNNVINPAVGDKAVLQYHLKSSGNVNIIVYTLDGNVVRTLQRGRQGKGDYKVFWDGKNGQGDIVARGLYLIRAVGPGFDEYRKVLVVK